MAQKICVLLIIRDLYSIIDIHVSIETAYLFIQKLASSKDLTNIFVIYHLHVWVAINAYYVPIKIVLQKITLGNS